MLPLTPWCYYFLLQLIAAAVGVAVDRGGLVGNGVHVSQAVRVARGVPCGGLVGSGVHVSHGVRVARGVPCGGGVPCDGSVDPDVSVRIEVRPGTGIEAEAAVALITIMPSTASIPSITPAIAATTCMRDFPLSVIYCSPLNNAYRLRMEWGASICAEASHFCRYMLLD